MANQNQQRDSFTASTPGEHCPGPPILYKRSGSQKRQRNRFWIIALNQEEEAHLMESAQHAGLSRSSYGRAVLLGTPGPRAKRKPHVNVVELAKAAAELNRAGNVLNQMQRSLNAGQAIVLGQECAAALAANRRACDAILELVGRKDRDDYQGEPA